MFSAGDPGHPDEHNRLAAQAVLTSRFDSVQAAIDSLEGEPGTVAVADDAPTVTEPLTIHTGLTLVGVSPMSGLASSGCDLIAITSNVSYFTASLLDLSATGGHVINITDGGLGQSLISRCRLRQLSDGFSAFSLSEANDEYPLYLDNEVCGSFLSVPATSTVPVWSMVNSGGGCNMNLWRRLRVHRYGSDAAPAFYIESTNNNWHYDNRFDTINFEQCDGGLIHGFGVNSLQVTNCKGYDTTTYADSLFKIGPSSHETPLASRLTRIESSGRVGGALGSGAFDVEATGGYGALVNVGPHSTTEGAYSIPDGWTVLDPWQQTLSWVNE